MNDGNCTAVDTNRSCGAGKQKQIRKCNSGTMEKCSKVDTNRTIDCSLPECIKEFGEWTNEGQCQVVGENKICAPGLQFQVRSCKDGKSDKCIERETFRHVPCRQNETEILCEGINSAIYIYRSRFHLY